MRTLLEKMHCCKSPVGFYVGNLANGAVRRCCMSANKHLVSESGKTSSNERRREGREGMSACNGANGWMTLYMEVVMSRVGSRLSQKSHGQTPQLMMVGDRVG